MKKKIILGILSCDPYNEKEEFLKKLSLNGFSIHSISSKIEEVAKYLLKSDGLSDLDEKDIDKIRNKGYGVNKFYWINLLLTSVPEKEYKIVIKDLWEDDLYEGYITPIVSDPILVPNMTFIRYPKSLSDNIEMKKWIDKIEEKMYNSK